MARLHFCQTEKMNWQETLSLFQMCCRLPDLCVPLTHRQCLQFTIFHILVYSYKVHFLYFFFFNHLHCMQQFVPRGNNDTSNKAKQSVSSMLLLCHHSHYILSLIFKFDRIEFFFLSLSLPFSPFLSLSLPFSLSLAFFLLCIDLTSTNAYDFRSVLNICVCF